VSETTLDLLASYAALTDDVAAVVVDFDVVAVRGPDALSYLQTQCSQDLTSLVVGTSIESLVLSPQGKLEAYVRVARTAEDAALVVVDAGFGEQLHERLRRFKLRVHAELALERWSGLALRGPEALAVEATLPEAVLLEVAWPGFVGVDAIGPSLRSPAGLRLASPAAFEARRIEAGVPAMGRELTEKTIVQESGLTARTVSFTKGCYPGQELVARIDARGGNVPKHLRGLLITAPQIEAGAEIVIDERVVGSVTSAIWSPGHAAVVALGYIGRATNVPAPCVVAEPGGGEYHPARIVELPIP